MSRRLWGLVVIGGVLLVAAVIPQIIDRTSAGSARMAPTPGPPSVGSCVLQPIGGTESMGGAQPILTTDSWVAYTAAPAIPCSGSRYGEVADVIPGDQAKTLAAQDQDGGAIGHRCAGEVNRYLGLDPAGNMPMFKNWIPAASISPFEAGPSQLQASIGQSWVACIAVIYGPDQQSTDYEQPLRNIYTGGHLTSALSVCAQTTDSTVGACSQPHDEEILADATGTPPNPTALNSSCLALAKAATGMADPTAAGHLKVYVTTPPKSGGNTKAVPQCIIASTNIHHKLVGPLISLGSKPIPWQ